MKEIKYNNNLKRDIECWKNFIREKDDNIVGVIFLTSIANFLIISIWLLYQNPFSYGLVGWMLFFGITDVSIKLSLYKYNTKRDNDIKKRLNDLILDLNQHNIEIELEELGKALILEENIEREVYVDKEGDRKHFINKNEKIEYFSVLDKNEQIQILKMIKNELLIGEDFQYEDYFSNGNRQLFLLDEEDINLLDSSLKRVLKKDK